MKTASTLYNTLRSDLNSWYEVRVVCGSNTYGMDDLKSVTVHPSISDESGVSIGNANSTECRITVMEESANWARMASFTVQFRINNQAGTSSSEWITVGTFYTDERSEDKYGNLSIVGYDAMLTMEQYWTDKVSESLLPSSWPITAYAFCTMLQSAGLCTFEDISKIDNTVSFIGLDTSSTIRDKLKDIASAHGGNWQITSDGKLRLVQFINPDRVAAIAGIAVAGIAIVGLTMDNIDETSSYPSVGLSMQTFDTSPALPSVSGVYLETEAGDTATAGTDTNYMVKAICNFASSSGVAENALSRITGFKYRPFEITGAYLDPIVEVGDIVVADGECFQIMNIDWDFSAYPIANMSAPYDEEVDHEYTYIDTQTKNYRKGMQALSEAEAELTSSIEQTATSITATVAASQKQYDTSGYTVTLYGYGAPNTTLYPASSYSGKYYLNQTDGSLYYSNGSSWSKVATLSLITTVQQASIETNATAIKAKVDETGGSNATNSFSWTLTSTGHKWYANGSSTPVVSITGTGLAVTGEINATSGYIGNGSSGFAIGSTSIYNTKSSFSSTNSGIYLGTDGIALGAYNSTNGSSAFQVTSAGVLTARSGTIGGFTISASNLYKTKSSMTSTSSGVYLGTDGIALGAYNSSNGNSPFQVDSAGYMQARSGKIGGFTISASAIYNGMTSLSDTTNTGVYIGTSGIALGKGAFKVTSGGVITATSGTIGGFTLSSSSMYTNSQSSYSGTGTGIYLGTSGLRLGSKFSVDTSGNVTASGLTITGGSISINGGVFSVNSSGQLTATSGTFSGTVYAGSIAYGSTGGYFNGAGLTTGSVAGGVNSSGYATAQLSASASQGVAYGNSYGLAVKETGGTYPSYFGAQKIQATSGFYSGVYKVYGEGGEVDYDLTAHYHTITVKDGKVQLGAPTATKPDPFDIASVTLASVGIASTNATNYTTYDLDAGDMSSYLYTSGNYSYGRINVKDSDDNTLKTIRVIVPALASVTVSGAAGLASDSSSYTTYDKAASFASSSIYTSGSTSYARIQVTLSNGNTAIIRAGIPASSSTGTITLARANYSSSEYYDSSIPYYKYSGSTGTVKVAAYVNGSVAETGDIDVTSLVNYALSMGAASASASGYVEVTSAIDGSAFVKLYDSSWNAIAINGSTAGRWINSGTSYSFGS